MGCTSAAAMIDDCPAISSPSFPISFYHQWHHGDNSADKLLSWSASSGLSSCEHVKDRAGWRIKVKNDSCIFSWWAVCFYWLDWQKLTKGMGAEMVDLCGIYIINCQDSHGFYDEKECAVDSLIESINRFSDWRTNTKKKTICWWRWRWLQVLGGQRLRERKHSPLSFPPSQCTQCLRNILNALSASGISSTHAGKCKK